MAYNVLVADDSLTIQKVVSITLSNGDFKLVESLNDSDLLAKVSSQTFDLILIDFNLSESKSGYDLCKEVHHLAPQTPILAMLGTFDSVDDSSLKIAGVHDKIVKPFESEKFITKCMALVNASYTKDDNDGHAESSTSEWQNESEESQNFNEDESVGEDFGDQWVVEGKSSTSEDFQNDEMESGFEAEVTTDFESEDISEKQLQSELEGWGIRVPGVIGDKTKGMGAGVLPPVISNPTLNIVESEDQFDNVAQLQDEAEDEEFSVDIDSQDDAIVPDQDDLEYPDLGGATPVSKLVPLEELSDNEEVAIAFDDDKTDPVVNLGALNELQKEIEEELSPDDFWAVDDAGENQTEVSELESSNDDISLQLESQNVRTQQVSTEHVFSQRDELSDDEVDRIAEKLKKAFTPLIQEMVDDLAKKYCQQSIDKVAWEVIPDLAENLIRKEIQNISDSVKNH